MNPKAKKFFDENPDAKYFYPNSNARWVNPRIEWSREMMSDPWPDAMGAPAG